ncbi:hypothetical protein [Nocardioides sp. NPDC127503]|uniref:hypothetical protein n=1 Tax=Nocardioides sp. NPDC127503 TaxID=3154516 RepID=UPI00331C73A5
MTMPLRVAHLPARTPYVRKLRNHEFVSINGTTLTNGHHVPDALSASWILDRRPLDWVDVVHLHHIEFEDETVLGELLSACDDAGVRVVHTIHDLTAMFGTTEDLHRKIQFVHEAGATLLCLTGGSATQLNRIVGEETKTWVAPHGYVVDPETIARLDRLDSDGTSRFLMYGALRPNRDYLSTLVNWALHTGAEDRLHLLMRGLSQAHMADPGQHAMDVARTAMTCPRIEVTMRGYPSDDDIINAGRQADVLVMPYRWGTHSGQLELAFDLGLLPLSSDVGCLRDQHAAHLRSGLVEEPEWFDWTNGNPYEFGERFVASLENTRDRIGGSRTRADRRAWADYRRAEHAATLAVHAEAYQAGR